VIQTQGNILYSDAGSAPFSVGPAGDAQGEQRRAVGGLLGDRGP
jgi:hypothetical protein